MNYSHIQIFHTNDLHSHLENWPQISKLLWNKQNEFKKQGHNVLLVDIGDHIDRVHPITEATLGKGNVSLMNDVGYDAVTIGNNEGITLSKEDLSNLYGEANFPVLVANLFDEETNRLPSWAHRYKILTMKDGLKIGIIGMTIPYQPFYEALGWGIGDPFELLPELIKEVREKANLVIFLSHLGLNFDEEIARKFTGIDVILGGHTHHVLSGGLKINRTIIHQAGKFGQFVGHLSIMYDQDKKEIFDYEATCLEVAQSNKCEKTEQKIMDLYTQTKRILDRKITFIDTDFEVSWEKTSSFPMLLATALKEWCNGEIGMVNSGVILDNLLKGPVSKGDLHRVCPHPINPCLVQLNGQILKETIQYSLSEDMINKKIRGFGFRGKVMGIMVFDGVTYDTVIMDDGLTHIQNIKINGEEIEANRMYDVATLDMYTFGHLFPEIAASINKKYFMPELLRDLLAWKLLK